jgi:hypothetical protein
MVNPVLNLSVLTCLSETLIWNGQTFSNCPLSFGSDKAQKKNVGIVLT